MTRARRTRTAIDAVRKVEAKRQPRLASNAPSAVSRQYDCNNSGVCMFTDDVTILPS